ncbi:hypothetical protein IWQ62_004644 [Dispira parvispora]|uniref:Nucleolus and neural progenitor protein-like N-terminal domain-containing protein n=1 Tax=Dispira parvispora TaxID=1520584 RepID=A0A9W8E5F3_9FUNG|nr:hypothetical protein IWQ62_004644 [Dispira parvispora]
MSYSLDTRASPPFPDFQNVQPAAFPTRSKELGLVLSIPANVKNLESSSSEKMRRLLGITRSIDSSYFWYEATLLSKMLLLRKKSMRTSVYYQRLLGVEKCIKRIREKDIECLLQWFDRTFPSSAFKGTRITYIPSRYALCCLAFQTGQLIKLLTKLQTDTQVAFKKQHITVAVGHLVEQSLTFMSICSRLHGLACCWKKQLCQLYDLLLTWLRNYIDKENAECLAIEAALQTRSKGLLPKEAEAYA